MTPQEQELWSSFAAEGAETLRMVEESLLRLEEEPGNAEVINSLYRGLHTLKGNAGFLSLGSFERTAHVCEDLVGLVRDQGRPLDAAMMDLLLGAVDALREGLELISSERRDPPIARVLPLIQRVEALFHERGGITREKPSAAFELFDEPGASLPVEAPEEAATPPALIGEEEALPAPAAPAAIAAPALSAPAGEPPALAPRRTEGDGNDVLRINAGKVATLMELAGELGLACSAVTRHPGLAGKVIEGFAAAAHKLELLVRDLQNDLSALRLVPMAPVFQRMRRVVRDASRRTGKKIDFRISGEETEIDKVMLDAIQDPLVHVLRNAVDHGIEPEEARVAAGKSPGGRVVLTASYQGGEVTVEVRDDGRGLDRPRILERARERGLCGPDEHPNDEEIARYIFLPGFSTKEVVDELSGRGVGMDVLKTTVESLRGRVQVKSNPGRGTSITMTIPLTLAFVEVMIVRERSRLFALPIEKVFEVSKVERGNLTSNSADGVTLLRVRGTLVPVLWLHEFWGEHRDPGSLLGSVVVFVQTARGVLAIPVDELLGNQQVMVKPLRGVLSGVRAAVGCGMLRTGDIAVALDCEQLHV